MHPLPLVSVWPYALVFWVVFVGVFAPEGVLTARTSQSRKQDAGSLQLVLGAQFLAMFAAFSLAFTVRSTSLQRPLLCFWIGLVVMVAGSALRHHCFRMLGSSFTTAVVVVADQAIIQRGAYRWIRHPSYTGGMLIFAGIGLALGNWVSLLVLAVIVPASYMYRVVIEERALLETLGEPYRDYMRRTRRFVPLLI
ncbi:MAG TPA: isoprenylcysteine carboxylmethyltransferase family protein [Candidatus Angelobacter sp.]|nr:isoprenylcysteine carboxylmethyltransferase family protein [Candidatus Angelobacter sp.]